MIRPRLCKSQKWIATQRNQAIFSGGVFRAQLSLSWTAGTQTKSSNWHILAQITALICWLSILRQYLQFLLAIDRPFQTPFLSQTFLVPWYPWSFFSKIEYGHVTFMDPKIRGFWEAPSHPLDLAAPNAPLASHSKAWLSSRPRQFVS